MSHWLKQPDNGTVSSFTILPWDWEIVTLTVAKQFKMSLELRNLKSELYAIIRIEYFCPDIRWFFRAGYIEIYRKIVMETPLDSSFSEKSVSKYQRIKSMETHVDLPQIWVSWYKISWKLCDIVRRLYMDYGLCANQYKHPQVTNVPNQHFRNMIFILWVTPTKPLFVKLLYVTGKQD